MDLTPDQWEKIKALFEATLQQQPAKRASFLARICPEAEVRAGVEKLLSNYNEAGSFLSEPILGKGMLEPDSARQEAFARGEVVSSRFKISRLLGRGGMGEIYEAEMRLDANASGIHAYREPGACSDCHIENHRYSL